MLTIEIIFQAINFYSRANNIKTGDPIILNNRSAAYIRWNIDWQLSFILLIIFFYVLFIFWIILLQFFLTVVIIWPMTLFFQPGLASIWSADLHQLQSIRLWLDLILQYMLKYVSLLHLIHAENINFFVNLICTYYLLSWVLAIVSAWFEGCWEACWFSK